MDKINDPLGRAVGTHVNAPAENLLFTAYRCWMAGYATGDVTCWDLAWLALERALPIELAKPLFGEFHHFVRTVREHARRDVGWRPAACRCLCRDECVVLALIEASQRQHEPSETVYAEFLLGDVDCEALIDASRSLGTALAGCGLLLCPVQQAPADPPAKAAICPRGFSLH